MSRANWTTGVFLAGDKSLGEHMLRALQEMRDLALTSENRVKVLAQFEQPERLPRLYALPSNLLSIQNTDAVAHTTGYQQEVTPFRNFEYSYAPSEVAFGSHGAATTLSKFVRLTRAAAAGDNLLVVLSGHGNGVVGEFLAHRGNGVPIDIGDVRTALDASASNGGKIDVLGMDCCNMSMIEVAWELAPLVRVLVGSEGFVANHGWPFRRVLESIQGYSPREAGSEIVHQFIDFYADYQLLAFPAHCAAIDLEGIGALVEAVRALAQSLLARFHDPGIHRSLVLAHWDAQTYKSEEYVDLGDLCQQLVHYTDDREVQQRCDDVIKVLDETVLESGSSGAGFQYSTGLSIYFPWCSDTVKRRKEGETMSDLEKYNGLEFSERTSWGELIDVHLEATRRSNPDFSQNSEALSEPAVVSVRRFPPYGKGSGLGATHVKNHSLDDPGVRYRKSPTRSLQ